MGLSNSKVKNGRKFECVGFIADNISRILNCNDRKGDLMILTQGNIH